MARILSLSPSEVLRKTRHLLLEREGHEVFSPKDAAEFDAISQETDLQLAVIGHSFPGNEKRQIALRVNKRFPGLPILELCFHSPEIPGADFLLTDSPAELLTAVREVLAGKRVRGFIG